MPSILIFQLREEDMARYDLFWERPEILGSGSDIRKIRTVDTLEEAMEAYRQGKCNRIQRYERVNGRLVTRVYDSWTDEFT